jgi:glycerophosphoryl diester phosphodiesterase
MKRRDMTRPLAASAAFFVALISLLAAPHQAVAAESCPEVIGHRAGANVAPENTAIGITKTAATGATTVEMDVRYTASGYPYLLHDETLDRTTTGTGPLTSKWVSDMGPISAADYAPWNTMRDPAGNLLYAGTLPNGKARTEVPFTGTWLQAIKDSNVDALLDAKVTPTQTQAANLMSYVNRPDLALASRLIYMGDPGNVTAMHGWYPGLRYAVIEYPPAGRVFTPDYLRSLGADTYAVPWPSFKPELAAYMHAAGLKLFVWTSDNAAFEKAANWQAMADAGVDAIITNEPAAAIAALATLCSSS